jgi:hypothetical protein
MRSFQCPGPLTWILNYTTYVRLRSDALFIGGMRGT